MRLTMMMLAPQQPAPSARHVMAHGVRCPHTAAVALRRHGDWAVATPAHSQLCTLSVQLHALTARTAQHLLRPQPQNDSLACRCMPPHGELYCPPGDAPITVQSVHWWRSHTTECLWRAQSSAKVSTCKAEGAHGGVGSGLSFTGAVWATMHQIQHSVHKGGLWSACRAEGAQEVVGGGGEWQGWQGEA